MCHGVIIGLPGFKPCFEQMFFFNLSFKLCLLSSNFIQFLLERIGKLYERRYACPHTYAQGRKKSQLVSKTIDNHTKARPADILHMYCIGNEQ